MFKQKFWLTIFVITQLFITLMISIGAWPQWVVFIELAAYLAAILLFDLEYALYSVILSIPFFLVVPNPKFDSFSTWRISIAFLFLTYLWKEKLLTIRGLIPGWRQKIKTMPWDKYLFGFILIAAVSLAVAEFKTIGIKKILFVTNIYLLYLLVLNIIKSKEQIYRAIAASFSSLAIIVGIGFVQYAATFAASAFNFWQYWATWISRAYYGATLANSEVYSNSWFNFVGNQPQGLRMFSILPDSHAFGVIAMFTLMFAWSLMIFSRQRFKENIQSKSIHKMMRILSWVFIVLSTIAVMLSGTRGIWAAAVAPIAFVGYYSVKKIGRKMLAPMLIPFFIFIILVGTSPLTQKVLNDIHAGDISSRVASIYDLQDTGNQGRIFVWKNTLKYFAHHPFLGTGYGNFIVTLKGVVLPNVPQYNQLSGATESTFNLPGRYITAHDFYLDILAETGLIGFIFFALWLYNLAKKHFLFFKKHYLFSEDPFVIFVVSAGLYMLWLFVYSLVDGTLINDRVLMYFFITLALSGLIMKNYEQS